MIATSPKHNPHIIIAGAGIGGLACGLMLHAAGFRCTVFEQAPQIRELGVGINLLPHAVAKLVPFGLLDDLRKNAIETHELFYLNRLGQTVWHELRGTAAGYDVPQFSFHRGRLQSVLLQALMAQAGSEAVKTDHKLLGFTQLKEGVRCDFQTAEGPLSVFGDALIGADGIHSQTRHTIVSGQYPTRWNGIIILRGATEWPRFLTGRSMLIAGGMDAKAVIYPIAEGTEPDRLLTNWSLNIKIGPDGSPPPRREDWSRRADREAALRYAQIFSLPQVDLVKLVEATNEMWEYPMCDRDALPHWSDGCVTLLGDAAHPMYPTGSNGAGQAILDADFLVQCLQTDANIPKALKRYEQERLAATAEIVRRNRIGGPENVIDVAEKRAPDGFEDIDAIMELDERRKIVEGYAKTAGFDREHVNLRLNSQQIEAD